MTAKAHGMRYRPLLSGIEIRNPNGAAPGTLGCIAVSNDNERWLVSCFHVLHGMDQAAPVDNQAIYQPTTDEDENIVAHTDSNRISAELDFAAARIPDNISIGLEILGIGRLGSVKAPELGMRVLKSGRSTGITEGRITSIKENTIEIEVPNGFPDDYELCEKGDSGALWVERDSRCPVGLLTGGTEAGKPISFAVPITTVLEKLGLQIPT